MQQVARSFLARDLTPSPLVVSSVFAVGTAPMLITPLIGGYLADRYDRKRLLIILEFAQMALALLMALLVTFDILNIPLLMVTTFMTGAVMGMSFPARQAMIPGVTDPDAVTNGVVLFTGGFSFTQIAAPTLSGVLIATAGAETPFFMALGLYAMALIVLTRIPRYSPYEGEAGPTESFTRSVTEGFRFVASHRLMAVLMVSAIMGTIMTLPVIGLLPIFQRDVLEVGPEGLGLMLGAFGVGALIASVILAIFSPERPSARVPLLFAMMTGIAIAAFSQSSNLGLSLALLVLVGFAQSGFMTMSMALIQKLAPREMLGRVVAIRMVVFGTVPLGLVAVGLGAEATSPEAALGVMGLVAALSQAAMLVWLRRSAAGNGAPPPRSGSTTSSADPPMPA